MPEVLLSLVAPVLALTWFLGRRLRRRLAARSARRKESDRVEHVRLTSWITETDDAHAPTLPLLRTSGGLVVMSPEAAGLVAAGKLTSRHSTG